MRMRITMMALAFTISLDVQMLLLATTTAMPPRTMALVILPMRDTIVPVLVWQIPMAMVFATPSKS
jgi:hypothetical protein